VLELMRRPPVLALATIVVLLGGVIVVGHHPDKVDNAAPAPVVQPETVAPAGSATMQVEAPPPAPPPPPPGEPPPKAVHHRDAEPKKPVKQKAPPPAEEKTGAIESASKLEIAGPTADGEDETVVTDAPKQQVPREEPLSVQLRRCRSAATHKDCANARTCAKQLEQRDRAYYDANVANDDTLKPCL